MFTQLADKYDRRDWYKKPSVPVFDEPSQPTQEYEAFSEKPVSSGGLEYLRKYPIFTIEFQNIIGRKANYAQPVERESIEQRFQRLANQWREETAHLSSMTKRVMHPAYQSIIGMGPEVLPILIRELQDNPNHWFWALRAITEEDPTQPEDAGNLQKMRESWLMWAKERDYL